MGQAAVGEVGVPAEAVENHPVGPTLRVEHRKDVVVSVPVVDHQRTVVAFRGLDMAAEDQLLTGDALGGTGAVVVQTGLADPANVRPGPDDAVDGLPGSQRLVVGHPGGVVRVDRDRGDDVRVGGGQLGRPRRAGQVAADLHDAIHPDRGSQFDTVDHPQARVLLGGVQVGVGVDGRCGQRLRQPRQPQPLDHGFGHFVPSPAARAASARS